MLRNAGYDAFPASSARQTLDILKRGELPVDLVLTDVVMPETDGRALGLLIAEGYAGLPVAYMSAYSENDIFHRGSPGPNLPFLRKPFSEAALLTMVNTVLVSPRAHRTQPTSGDASPWDLSTPSSRSAAS